MRHKSKLKKPSSESPPQAGNKPERETKDPQSRLRVKVGPPEASWSHAKWLALVDQALQD